MVQSVMSQDVLTISSVVVPVDRETREIVRFYISLEDDLLRLFGIRKTDERI